jgi:hypothetical protein
MSEEIYQSLLTNRKPVNGDKHKSLTTLVRIYLNCSDTLKEYLKEIKPGATLTVLGLDLSINVNRSLIHLVTQSL